MSFRFSLLGFVGSLQVLMVSAGRNPEMRPQLPDHKGLAGQTPKNPDADLMLSKRR